MHPNAEEEQRLWNEPWYHDFAPLGIPTYQRDGIFRPNQAAKQGPLFDFIGQAIDHCQAAGTALRGVELFCADGFYSHFALQRGASHMTGLDLDTVELAKARLVGIRLGHEQKAMFLARDVHELTGQFDFGICAGGLYHVQDPDALLAHLSRHVAGPLVVQTVISLAETRDDYFECPAPGWNWGCRFSFEYFKTMLQRSGWQIRQIHCNELLGNARPEDRGSAYALCVPAK
jgi:hypothetical protein